MAMLSAPYVLHGQDAYVLFGVELPKGLRYVDVVYYPTRAVHVVRWVDPQDGRHEMELGDQEQLQAIIVAMKLTC